MGGSALPNSGATSHIVVDHSKFEHVNENIKADNHVMDLADGSRPNTLLEKPS